MLGLAAWVGGGRSSCTESPGVPLLTMICHWPSFKAWRSLCASGLLRFIGAEATCSTEMACGCTQSTSKVRS